MKYIYTKSQKIFWHKEIVFILRRKTLPNNNFDKPKINEPSLDSPIRKNNDLTRSWVLETEVRCVQ